MKLHHKIFSEGVAPDQVEALHRINMAGTPGVSAESVASLSTLLELGTTLVVHVDGDEPAAFINLVEPGTHAYDSPNLRWFEAWAAHTSRDLIYVDRIAVRADLRGNGLGQVLYRLAFGHFSHREWIGCEVNSLPPNPGSDRFHAQLGFRSVGEQVFVPGEKAVTYYARPLPAAGDG